MPNAIKIATCNYCSSRTLLKPTARDGHELACGSCGAPLHEMKWLKRAASTAPRPKMSKPRRPTYHQRSRPAPNRKRRKRRGIDWSDLLEDAWDFVEDVFD